LMQANNINISSYLMALNKIILDEYYLSFLNIYL